MKFKDRGIGALNNMLASPDQRFYSTEPKTLRDALVICPFLLA